MKIFRATPKTRFLYSLILTLAFGGGLGVLLLVIEVWRSSLGLWPTLGLTVILGGLFYLFFLLGLVAVTVLSFEIRMDTNRLLVRQGPFRALSIPLASLVYLDLSPKTPRGLALEIYFASATPYQDQEEEKFFRGKLGALHDRCCCGPARAVAGIRVPEGLAGNVRILAQEIIEAKKDLEMSPAFRVWLGSN